MQLFVDYSNATWHTLRLVLRTYRKGAGKLSTGNGGNMSANLGGGFHSSVFALFSPYAG